MAEVNPNPDTRHIGEGKEPYAYTIKDVNFEDFPVLNSANGWWLNQVKVELLIAAYKIDCTNEEACAYAGISAQQLKDFRELHPQFQLVKQACKQLPFVTARNSIVAALKTDPRMALDYMERKKKHEFGKRDEHVIIPTEKTLEDLFDEYENENAETQQQGTDREAVENQEQDGGSGAVPPEHPTELLLGEEKKQEPNIETPPKGTEQDN